MLYLPTCVGLRYGQYDHKFSGFSRRSASPLRFPRRFHSSTLVSPAGGFACRPKQELHAHYQQSRWKLGPRPHITDHTGAGISTGCPSATTFVLALGPTKLQRTSLPEEPLGFRWTGFSPVLSLLMSASSLVSSPPLLTLWLRSTHNAPLPPPKGRSIASVTGLSPLTLSAQNAIRPVSCYALFKWWLLLSQHPGCLWNSTSFYT